MSNKRELFSYVNLDEVTTKEFEEICKNDRGGPLNPEVFFGRIVGSHIYGNCSILTLAETYDLDIAMVEKIINTHKASSH